MKKWKLAVIILSSILLLVSLIILVIAYRKSIFTENALCIGILVILSGVSVLTWYAGFKK